MYLPEKLKRDTRQIAVFSLEGKEYTPVSTIETLPTVKKAGFNNPIYAPRYCPFDFVKRLMEDEKTVSKLHENITDNRPVIFKMEKGITSLNQKKMAHGGEICHGNGWLCMVAEEEDAWLVFVVTSDDT